MPRTLYALALLPILPLGVAPAGAEDMPADNTEIMIDAARADKKALVAQSMQLTEAEAAGFWPIYDAYQTDLEALDARLGALIDRYAEQYNARTLTDETAKELIDENLAIDAAEVQLRKDCLARLEGVLPTVKAARYLQIESKLRSILRYQLAGRVPLAEGVASPPPMP